MKIFIFRQDTRATRVFFAKTWKIMRLFTLFVVAATVQISAKGFSQNITINASNISLEEAFSRIEAQTGYSFFVNHALLEKSTHVDLSLKDATIDEALNACLKDQPFTYSIIGKTVILEKRKFPERAPLAALPDIQIKGVITDSATGKPLAGVTIQVKGSTTGATTDATGKFTVLAPRDAVLEISYLGYGKKEIPVNGRQHINVSLASSATGLNQLVVVGYGTKKKVDLTGAVATVSGDRLVNKPVTGTTDALQGVLPGVVVTRSSSDPGQEGYNIQIRGLTSVNNNPVLVLIDGIEGNIDDVRPEDIESISVLKDAASASIYGAKAAGGVILITTKKGKAGKIKVDFNSYYSASKIGRTQQRVSALQVAKMRNEADVNSGGSASLSDEDLAKLADPKILWDANPSSPNEYRYWGNYDYKKLVLKNYTPMMSHSIAVSGGTDKTTFRLSGTYYKNDGSVKIGPDENTKYSARLNLNTEIGKYLSLSNNISYSNNGVEKPIGSLDGAYGLFAYVYTYPGITPVYDPNGHLAYGARIGAFDGRVKFADFSYQKGIHEWNYNNARVNSTLTIKNLVKGLQFRVVGAVDANFDKEFEQVKPIALYGIDGSVIGDYSTASSLTKGEDNSAFKEFQFLVDYDLKVHNHSFHLLGGYSGQEYRAESIGATVQGLVNKDLPDFNWASSDNIDLSDNVATNKFQSVFGRLNYNYKDKYLFEGNLRYDGSSKLAPGNRYKLFPSASAGWRISQEPWFQSGFLNELKLRASYGELGNADVLGNYNYIALLNKNNDLLLGMDGGVEQQADYTSQNVLASSTISWEVVQSSNIGADLGLFNNRLSISADYYVKRNKNMLANVSYPSVIGIGLPLLNAGELKTWGWEASIGWKGSTGKLSYWVNGNIGDAQNKLVHYLGKNVIRPGRNALIEGMPVNSIYGYKTDGLFQSQEQVDKHAFQNNVTGPGDVIYVDLNGDNKISAGSETEADHGDLVYLGNDNPRYTFGLQGGLSWKGFDVTLFFQGVGKRVFLLDNTEIEPFQKPWFGPQKHNLDYWTPQNTDAFWPRLYSKGNHNFLPSDKWIQNAAYVRLKDAEIGYTLPLKLVSKFGASLLRFYLDAHDSWEATGAMDFIDPETPDNASFQYPFRRVYTVGVNLSF